jgi:effector-binding domain-containing protein
VPIAATLSAAERVAVYALPGHEWAACAIQHGSHETLDQAACALYDWIAANGYRSAGPSRQVYLRFGLTGRGADYPEYYRTFAFSDDLRT